MIWLSQPGASSIKSAMCSARNGATISLRKRCTRWLPKSLNRADEARILPRVRHALRTTSHLHIHYTDAKGESTRRTIWPLALGYFEDARLLAAWCELRGDFRHFRCERITSADPGKPYPVPHTELLRRWQAQEEVDLFKRYGF